ncbi:hypothetical protein VIA_003287 [Vibrio orientalis CIP 102891 = ATCC 33934]|uniref:Uncharacterized protein n=1 Tax=Vibrio orientalis CIP 102891 = ATCC 33934 TaxID=675816 RepID=A0ABP2GXN2_VIBOR|nr:hypothetical protein VIA_003287 [Vibrio orientalis CIP 102891 = ATCC 33934]
MTHNNGGLSHCSHGQSLDTQLDEAALYAERLIRYLWR